ncbi:ABC transporter ATP-binding protein [Clostridium sp. HCP1S3_B4]|uniref:ABC transporter ATP-binding protein n=1 Tax=unclassified Clostridium TaxID=2614128 RepID=UPI003F8A7F7F
MIELKNVIKTYGNGEAKVHALNNINIKIERGEFVAIVGPSGSGKSTLLNILGGIDTLSSGTYYLNSKEISSLSSKNMAHLRNDEFGFILQYFGLINDYTVYENVALPLKYSKKKIKNKKELVREMLRKLSIENKENSYPTELSGGQCQRVAIARALINNPNIILADEPTGALDKKTGIQIMEILKQLNEEGKTVIIVSHDENIYSKCNRIIRIEDGNIIDN